MKVKFRREDFRVQEVSCLEVGDEGPYGVYLLTKSGWTTPGAVERVAQSNGLSLSLFRWGGMKDRRAVTEQVLTVRSARELGDAGDGITLRRLGRSRTPMTPGAIVANRFEVVLRDLGTEEATSLGRAAVWLRQEGFANYFDDQRFGSLRGGGEYAGEHVVRRDWPRALWAVLAAGGPADSPRERDHRSALREAWGGWPRCLALAADPGERRAFRALAAEPSAARLALNLLLRERIYYHLLAWQSHVWNEVLRELVRRRGAQAAAPEPGASEPPGSWPGADGPYLFPPPGAPLPPLALPTLGRGLEWPGPEVERLCREVLLGLRLEPERFVLRHLPKAQLRSSLRPAAVIPEDLSVGRPRPDADHPGRLRARLTFRLPAGCYGTMLVKAVFASPGDA